MTKVFLNCSSKIPKWDIFKGIFIFAPKFTIRQIRGRWFQNIAIAFTNFPIPCIYHFFWGKLEWYDIATAEEKIKLKWTDKITEMVTELMYICFHNNHLFLEQTGTVSSNYSRLSICQMFLFHETLL